MRENADQKNYEYEHFSRSEELCKKPLISKIYTIKIGENMGFCRPVCSILFLYIKIWVSVNPHARTFYTVLQKTSIKSLKQLFSDATSQYMWDFGQKFENKLLMNMFLEKE